MKKASVSEFAFSGGALTRRIRQRKRPVQPRSRATVEALLEATLQVLLTRGYAGLTTTRVAERAGVSVGSLYQYYPDKRSLVTALKVQYFEQVVGRVAGAARTAVGMPLRAAIAVVVRELIAVKREHRALTLALRGPLAEEGAGSFVREASRQLTAMIVELLVVALPGIERPALAGRILVAAIEGAVAVAVFEETELLDDEGFVAELCALAEGYLVARAVA